MDTISNEKYTTNRIYYFVKNGLDYLRELVTRVCSYKKIIAIETYRNCKFFFNTFSNLPVLITRSLKTKG